MRRLRVPDLGRLEYYTGKRATGLTDAPQPVAGSRRSYAARLKSAHKGAPKTKERSLPSAASKGETPLPRDTDHCPLKTGRRISLSSPGVSTVYSIQYARPINQ